MSPHLDNNHPVLYNIRKEVISVARGNEGRRGIPACPPEGYEPEGKYVRTYITIDPELRVRIEKYCDENERAISWCVRKALDEWLQKQWY